MNHDPQVSGLRIKIDFAQASDPGRDPNKQVNEDACGYQETRFGHLAVLCDGMGGHYGGREASRTAITTIFEVFEQMPGNMLPAQALKSAIEEAGRRVYLLGGPPENRTRPGSTVVAMLLHDKGLDVAHVGDSRAYIIRSSQIYPLTRDHSMVQGMIDAGMLTEETAMGHPDSNKITRALGMKPDVDVELRPDVMELYPGDVLLQSSDGLTDLALGRDILGATRQALASGGVEHACTMLVKMANERGGHDNITVQMLRVHEVPPKTSTTIPERPATMGTSPPNPGAAAARPPVTIGAAASAPLPTQITSPDGTPAAFAYGARPAGYDGASPTAPQVAAAGGGAPANWTALPPQEQTLYAAPMPAAGPAPAALAAPPSPYAPAHHETPAWSGAPPPVQAPTPLPSTVSMAAVAAPNAVTMGTSPTNPGASYTPHPSPVAAAAVAPGAPPAHAPAPGLAAYRLDAGAGSLPLPPHSTRSYGTPGPPPAAPGAYGTPMPGPAALPSMGASAFTPEPGGFAPPAALGAPRMTPIQPASRAGVVYVIIGLSAIIAVLILVVLVLALR